MIRLVQSPNLVLKVKVIVKAKTNIKEFLPCVSTYAQLITGKKQKQN